MIGKLPIGSKKKVYLLNPIDYRGIEYNVETEDDLAVTCKQTEDKTLMVFKHEPGWKFKDDTKFFVMEGEPITAYMDQDTTKTASIQEFLKTAWGKDAYQALPDELKLALINWGCTVTVLPSLIEREAQNLLDRVKAAVLLRDTNLKQLKDFGESETEKKPLQDFISGPVSMIGIALGFLAGVVAVSKGWF